MLQWFGGIYLRQSRSETLLPCSAGRADVNITNGWIYFEVDKKHSKKQVS